MVDIEVVGDGEEEDEVEQGSLQGNWGGNEVELDPVELLTSL